MKIGIFGGSFNPIHNAHIKIANFFINKLNLDLMIVIPVGTPSHKNTLLAPEELRFQMCKEAFKKNTKVIVSDIEIKRNRISYTIDTLKELIAFYGKNNSYYEIIGEDSANNFTTWKDYKEIMKLSTVVVFQRPNDNKNQKIEGLIYFKTPLYNLSSTLVREKIKNKEDFSTLVPAEVKKIIIRNKLYLADF